jgi:GNAT superfamily N-acetyltransferase
MMGITVLVYREYGFNTKLWTGKYIELDNVVTDKNHRSKGVGKLINDFAAEKAKQLGCKFIVFRCVYRKP